MRKTISFLLLLLVAVSASGEVRSVDIMIFGMD